MRRALKWIGGILLVLILLPVLLVGGALIWANTDSGGDTIARLAGRFVPGLTITGLRGGLPGHPRIERITMADDRGIYLTVDNALLDLDLGALLRRQVHIAALKAERVAFDRLPVSTAPEPAPTPREGSLLPQLPQLPVDLVLDAAEVGRFELGEAVAGRAAALNIQAGGRYGTDGLFLGAKARRLDAPGALDADVAMAPGQRVKLLLNYDEPAGGMVAGLLGVPPGPATARVSLDGPATGAALALTARIGDGVSAKIDGTLALPADGGIGLQAKGNLQAPALLPQPVTGGDFTVDLRPENGGLRLNALTVDAAPGHVEAKGFVGNNSDLRLTARLGNASTLGTLLPAGLGWSGITLDGHVTGSTSAPAVEAHAVVADPRFPQAPPTLVGDALTVDVKADGQRVDHLTVAGAGINAKVSGAYRDALNLAIEASMGDARALGTLLPEGIGWGGLNLSGTVTGTTADPTVDARLVMRAPRLPEPAPGLLGAEPVLALRGNLRQIERLELTGAGLTATASGQYRDPLDLKAQIRLANAAATGQPVRGELQADLHVGGTTANPSVNATVTSPLLEAQGRKIEGLRLEAALPQVSPPTGTATLRGRVDGQALSLDAASALEGTVLRISKLALVFGPANLQADGSFDTAAKVFTGQALLQAANLAPLSGLAGAPLSGGLRLEAKAMPDSRGTQAVQANLRLNNLSAAGTPVDGTVSANGPIDALNLQAQVTAAGARASTRARLALLGEERRIELSALDVARDQLGVRLTGPATVVQAANGAIRINNLNLAARQGGSLRVAGTWGPQTADLRAVLTALPVSIVNLFVPEPTVAGTVSADVRVTGATSAPSVDATARATGLKANAPWAAGIPPASLDVTARMRGQAIEANATLAAGSATRATLEARLPQGAGGNAPIQATLRGNADLGVIAAPLLAAGANRATGRLTIDAQAAGTVSAPRLSGGAQLAGGSFRNLEYGAALRNIAAQVTLQGDRVVLQSLSADGTKGTLTAQGEAQPFAAGQPINLTLATRGLQPVTSDLFTGTFNSDVTLSGGISSGLRTAGRIEIPTATIGIPNSLPGSVADLGPIEERGRNIPRQVAVRARTGRPGANAQAQAQAQQTANTAAAPIALDLTVVVPGRFYVRGHGLDAEMAGELKVTGFATAPLINGGLRMVRGNFTVLDRRINFSRGNLNFGGSLTPDLDFLATSTVQSTTINIAVTGQPSAPKIEFSSSPELPQDEVLARLLFRRSTSQLSPFQIAQIAQVLAGATGLLDEDSTGGGFLSRIGRSLGLDRLGVGSGSTGALGVEAGGYLGDGIYLNVDPGATTGQPRVGVEVELTPRLKVESSTGTDGQSLGLTYEYEY